MFVFVPPPPPRWGVVAMSLKVLIRWYISVERESSGRKRKRRGKTSKGAKNKSLDNVARASREPDSKVIVCPRA